MSLNHLSPSYSLPSFRMKQVNTTTWGANANQTTISDSYIFPNSIVLVQVNSTSVQPAGRWSYGTPTEGSITIYSSDAESSTLPLQYIIL